MKESEAYDSSDKIVANTRHTQLANFQDKMSLHGGLKEKYEQLDFRETDLLAEIARLNKANNFLKQRSTSPEGASDRLNVVHHIDKSASDRQNVS